MTAHSNEIDCFADADEAIEQQIDLWQIDVKCEDREWDEY